MPPIPEQFGRYQIVRLLGEGGMGAVYLANDGSLGRKVALKIPQLSGPDAAQTRERFLREARLAATLDHPNICPVFDVGELDGTPYLTMRYIEGRPLSRYINPERLQSPRNVALIIRKLADALQHAHELGVVHRDLKPANVMVDAKNEPIVMDFGLARQMGGANEKQVTQSGMIVGTPAYMSPEQVALESDQVDHRTDIWSLGVIFFEMLTGKLPYDGTVLQIIGALQHLDPPTAQDVAPTAPERLSALCRKMTTRDRDQRYQTMRAVAEDLTAWIHDPTRSATGTIAIPELASVTMPQPSAAPPANKAFGTQFDFASLSMERPAAVISESGMSGTGTSELRASGTPSNPLTQLVPPPSPTLDRAVARKKPRLPLPPWAVPGAVSALTLVALTAIVLVFAKSKPTRSQLKMQPDQSKSATAVASENADSTTNSSQVLSADARRSPAAPRIATARAAGSNDGPPSLNLLQRRWVHPSGTFERLFDGTWLEWTNGLESFRFWEAGRDSGFVELADLKRACKIRLYDTHAEIAWNGQSFARLFDGQWVDRPKMPRALEVPLPNVPLKESYGPEDAWIDLLGWSRHTMQWSQVNGNEQSWRFVGNELRLENNSGACRFVLPAVLEGDYELEVEFTRHDGREAKDVVVAFPINVSTAYAFFGTGGGTTDTVGTIDGVPASRYPNQKRPSPIRDNVRHRATILVNQTGAVAGFQIALDGEQRYFSWNGAHTAVGTSDGPWNLPVVQHAAIGSWDASVTFHTARIRMLSGTLRRGFRTQDDTRRDALQGFARIVDLRPRSVRVNFSEASVNRIQAESWVVFPYVTPKFSRCDDYWFAHAPSTLKCRVPEGASSFSAVGYCAASADVSFNIDIDGKSHYRSGRTASCIAKIALPPNARELLLSIDSLGNAAHDRSYWCHPRFHGVPVDQIADDRLDEAVPKQLHCDMIPVKRGESAISHNGADAPFAPLHWRSVKPCHEFLFAHAASELVYEIPEGMTRFTAVGWCPRSDSVKYIVVADGRKVFESPQAGIVDINAKLPKGSKTLALVIDDLGNWNCDVSYWCYPRLHRE